MKTFDLEIIIYAWPWAANPATLPGITYLGGPLPLMPLFRHLCFRLMRKSMVTAHHTHSEMFPTDPVAQIRTARCKAASAAVWFHVLRFAYLKLRLIYSPIYRTGAHKF